MILTAVLALILLITALLFWGQGAWSNILNFFNMVFAGLVAMSFFEPIATAIEEQGMRENRFFMDFVVWWTLFITTYIVFRLAADAVSRHRVEYLPAVEMSVCAVMSIANGFLFVSIVSATLHLAPLGDEPFQNSDIGSGSFLGLSPDRMWLGFVGHQSRNTMSGSEEFSGDSYMSMHDGRRSELEKLDGYRAAAPNSGGDGVDDGATAE